MKIVVGGYIVSFPLGGMTWHHLNYLLGLRELGHELFFLEDGGEWLLPYNPTKQRCEPDSSYGRAFLQRTLRDFDLPIGWSYYSQAERRYYGASERELFDTLKHADLLICVSGVTAMRPDRPRPRRALVVDTDPGFTQVRMAESDSFHRYYAQFDARATFGRLIGSPACQIPTHGLEWIPTNQPISLPHWPVTASRSRRFTTIGKWEHVERHVRLAGQTYLSSKGEEWSRLIDLPARVPAWELAFGMQSMSYDLRAKFQAHGWSWIDPEIASSDCQAFAELVCESAGEFSVAKHIYAQLRSGWFSDRSACYLASGRPVVTQATGFENWLPVGSGLCTFESVDEASQALCLMDQHYASHARCARGIAEDFFDAKKVLRALLDHVMDCR